MSNDKLQVLDDKSVKNLNTVLSELIESGEVKVSELNPSLSALLSDETQGGFPGRAFVGSVAGYRVGVMMPSFEDKDDLQPVDVLELKDVTGNFLNNTFNFYARNGGMKAKIAGVKDSKFILIAYKGEVEAEKKSYNPYKDYLIVGADKKESALLTLKKVEEAVGRPSATGGAALVGAGAAKK